MVATAGLGITLEPLNAFEIDFRTHGGDETLPDRLSGASLLTTAKEDGTTGGQDVVAAAQSDYKRMISVLYGQGYFSPKISIRVNGQEAADISPFANIATVSDVVVDVTPGPRFLFGRTEMAPLTPETELTEDFAPKAPANLNAIESAAREGIDGWRTEGHAKARVSDQSITADHRNSELDVDITLEPGPKLRFGKLTYRGDSKVPEARVLEIADLPEGAPFSPETVSQVSARLRRTETFRSIDLREADTPNADDTLDMELTVVDNAPRRFGFGAELESRDGLSLTAFWLHRNLRNQADSLRFDAAIENLGAQSSGVNYRVGTLYTRPATLRSNVSLTLGAELKQEDEDLYFLRQLGASVGLKRIHSDRFETSLALTGFFSDVDDNFGERHFKAIGVSSTTKLDRRDNISNPTRGYYVEATAFPYAGGGDAESTLYLEGDLRAYRGFGSDNGVIAAGRLQLGSIIGPSLSETPPDLLFYSGGGGTVRGQPYQSNFVTVDGIESGGLSFLGLSGELRVKITDTISTVAFYDAGFVGESAALTSGGSWHAGAGLGVRYNTGFGPLRLDLGLPVSGGTGDGVQLYIGIGHTY
ncbi:autotransporter assembly complex protein TamA [Shimia marina]|uniref:Autotransporter assembly factor TamA n=1 Tax=Shimia marina TaxID=321267 RepID=A0A0P1EMQ6_9RHOB|nr:BamA/TamA family outer membrane protein [Shimia marina]CUH51651.1 Autotransporter assembly factor TamA [Shimia marina]SFD43851.1 translocation and assembly module TamA [Shimia marina]